jgi:adenylate cyclase
MSITQPPEKLRMILWVTVISAAIGAVYAEFDVARHGLANFAWYGAPRGALTGALIASILTSLEIYLLWGTGSLRRVPFPVHVAIKTLIYLVVIVFALSFSAWVFPAPREAGVERVDVLFSLMASFVIVFIMAINRLLGQNVLLSFVTGRYHRPRLEERVLLFIDMEGSTGLAERLGPLAFHRLLNCFVTDLTDPIVAARGEIYGYVGDELIATWKLEEGINQANCVRACFDAFDAVARKAREYRREFGAAVNFRAGLHCGPLVTGEMGSVKTEIVFLGDAVNTAARIQELCRQTGDRILASADLIDRLQLPPGIVKRSLGDLRLRGKDTELALYALTHATEERSEQDRGRRPVHAAL